MKYFRFFAQTMMIWFGLLFVWFLFSGTPLLNNPQMIDGKGPPMANHACLYKNGLSYCTSSDYWAQAPGTALFSAIGIVLQPIAFIGWIDSLPQTFFFYLLPIPIFIYFVYKSRKEISA